MYSEKKNREKVCEKKIKLKIKKKKMEKNDENFISISPYECLGGRKGLVFF